MLVGVVLKIYSSKQVCAVPEALRVCSPVNIIIATAWLLHEAFSEALQRLFQEHYIPEVPESLLQFAENPPGTAEIENLLADESIKTYIEYYNQQLAKCLNCEFGKTPRFWAILIGNKFSIMQSTQMITIFAYQCGENHCRPVVCNESSSLFAVWNFLCTIFGIPGECPARCQRRDGEEWYICKAKYTWHRYVRLLIWLVNKAI